MKTSNNLSTDLFNISYAELLNETSNDGAKERLAAWIGYVHSFNKSQRLPTRIVEEDATLWLKNGFSPDEDLQLEQMFSSHTCDNNMSILCAFDISSAESDINSMMRSIISAHDYVILDEPPAVYTRATRSIRNKRKNHHSN
jgi:hypothetical protein